VSISASAKSKIDDQGSISDENSKPIQENLMISSVKIRMSAGQS
jgi:hypothetical protein